MSRINAIFPKLFLLLLTLLVSPVLVYIFHMRNLVIKLYQDSAPSWVYKLVANMYPRFAVEKNRFPLDFFLEKADQVVLRYGLVLILVLFIFSIKYLRPNLWSLGLEFWERQSSLRILHGLRPLFVFVNLYLIYDWLFILRGLHKISDLYQPVFLLKIFNIPLPGPAFSYVLFSLLLISLLGMLWKSTMVPAALIFAVLFILIQGFFFSFYKLDHTYATWNYAVLLQPFLYWEAQKALKKGKIIFYDWPLRLIQSLIGLVYLLSGIEKLLIAKWHWFNPENLAFHLQNHGKPLGIWLSGFPILLIILNISVILFDLSFWAIIIFPSRKYLFILAGISFHLSTYLFMGVGGWLSPWILVYIFFLDDLWEKLSGYFQK